MVQRVTLLFAENSAGEEEQRSQAFDPARSSREQGEEYERKSSAKILSFASSMQYPESFQLELNDGAVGAAAEQVPPTRKAESGAAPAVVVGS